MPDNFRSLVGEANGIVFVFSKHTYTHALLILGGTIAAGRKINQAIKSARSKVRKVHEGRAVSRATNRGVGELRASGPRPPHGWNKGGLGANVPETELSPSYLF